MKHAVIFLISMFSLGIFAQEQEGTTEDAQKKDTTLWKTNIKAGVTFNSVQNSENWTSGGNDATSIGSIFYGKAAYQSEIIEWVSQTDLQYGRTQYETGENEKESRKSVDKLSFDSKFAYRLNKNLNAFSSLSLMSQFDEGNKYKEDTTLKISGFFSPAYITSSWGAEYKPNDHFYARFSPFSPRITIVNDTGLYRDVPENYGVEVGEKIRYEWKAFKISASYNKNIVENISLKADYELFANVDDFNFDKIDHRFDLFVTAKIYKFINLTLTGNLIKDLDQVNVDEGDNKWQTSFQIGLSILFNYQNYEEE